MDAETDRCFVVVVIAARIPVRYAVFHASCVSVRTRARQKSASNVCVHVGRVTAACREKRRKTFMTRRPLLHSPFVVQDVVVVRG
jgi:hypothetical protein